MKKTLFGLATLITVAVAIILNVNFRVKSHGLSDVALANVEALARSENGDSCAGPKALNIFREYYYCLNSNPNSSCDADCGDD